MKYGIKMNTCGVYLIRNKTTGDFYIGSSVNISSRLSQHFRLSKNVCNDRLHNDVLKYGVENFEWEVLCQCPKERLLEMEQYFYDTMKPTYNYVRPCECHVTTEIVQKKSREASRREDVVRRKKELYCQPEYREKFREIQRYRMKGVSTVINGEKRVFESLSDAARWVTENTNFEGKNKVSKIKSVCDGERPTAYGFKWQYVKCNDYPEGE